MKYQNIIEDVLIACGITISLTNIQQVLSIILLVFNVLWILWKVGYNIYNHIKNKNYEQIGNEIKTATDELQVLSDKVNDKDSKGKQ